MAKSSIEWTDLVWNPVTGCDKVSQGCKNCYAEVMHKRLTGMGQKKYSTPFNGNVYTHAGELYKPLEFPKGKRVFVNSMSDLFHEDVSFDFIDNVFAVMDCRPDLTFQILTKRAERMLLYLKQDRSWRVGQLKVSYNSFDYDLSGWPLKNVILGTSVEDQENYNKRVSSMFFIKEMGWRTMLSAEPLLGQINLFIKPGDLLAGAFDWVITGGESGHHARPVHPDWIRSLRDQCAEAYVPFFFKQWGEWEIDSHVSFNGPFLIHGKPHRIINIDGRHYPFRDIFDPTPDPCNLTKKDNAYWMVKTGKHASGNFLDGKQHLEFPKGGTNG